MCWMTGALRSTVTIRTKAVRCYRICEYMNPSQIGNSASLHNLLTTIHHSPLTKYQPYRTMLLIGCNWIPQLATSSLPYLHDFEAFIHPSSSGVILQDHLLPVRLLAVHLNYLVLLLSLISATKHASITTTTETLHPLPHGSYLRYVHTTCLSFSPCFH